jgi:hypothetical protein
MPFGDFAFQQPEADQAFRCGSDDFLVWAGSPTKNAFWRTRTRTLDPLIKSHRKTVKYQDSF